MIFLCEITGTEEIFLSSSNWNDKNFHPMQTQYFSNLHQQVRLIEMFSSCPIVTWNDINQAFPTFFTGLLEIFIYKTVTTIKVT